MLLLTMVAACASNAPSRTLKAENKRLRNELADMRSQQTETDAKLKALHAQLAQLDQVAKDKDIELAKLRTENSASWRELAEAVPDRQQPTSAHDLGRAAVPSSIWERKGKLTMAEWEQIRLHAYFTDRILRRSPLLSELAPVAAADHERIDGSGYPRNVPASMIGRSARLLAAADVYHALTEPRPQRPALAPDAAANVLRTESRPGKLDHEAVAAVLEAAGHGRARIATAYPAGLTDREVQVLRLVARGQPTKQIALALSISARTAQHHVIHIYEKIGVSSRAAAALFAVENGLLGDRS